LGNRDVSDSIDGDRGQHQTALVGKDELSEDVGEAKRLEKGSLEKIISDEPREGEEGHEESEDGHTDTTVTDNTVESESEPPLPPPPVDVSDEFRFPLEVSSSFDPHKPLHLRRVQLWWPHCEEWFSGTIKLQPSRK
jgi:hypothetical protein